MSRKAAWVDEKLVESWMAKSFFWGGSAYALRGYGVTLGSSSRMTHFSAAQRRFGVAYSLIGEGVDRVVFGRGGVREWFGGFRGEIWAMRDDGHPGVWLGGGDK